MPFTSGLYNFQSVETELLIREAFERIGILGEYVEAQKLESAKRSINILLLDWMTKSTNLWTIKDMYQGLIPGKRQYFMNNTVNDILQVNVRTSSRQLGGIAQTNTADTYDNNGGGDANEAFDGDQSTSCEQTVNNGNISYDFGLNHNTYITFVGIMFPNNLDYELLIEACYINPDNPDSWSILRPLPLTNYAEFTPYFFDIDEPNSYRFYRIRGINNTIPLDVSEIYFNNNTFDVAVGEISRYEYNNYPNKYIIGRPSVYYFDRNLPNPVLNIWPTASTYYNCLAISYKKMMQDVGEYYDTLDVPAKLYPALIWGLTWQLALKFKPELAEQMQAKYEEAFKVATMEDSEDATITIERGRNNGL